MGTVVLGFWFCFGIVVGLALYPRLANLLVALGRWQASSGCRSPRTGSHEALTTPTFPEGRRRPRQGAVGPVSVAIASNKSWASLPLASWWWRCSRVRA